VEELEARVAELEARLQQELFEFVVAALVRSPHAKRTGSTPVRSGSVAANPGIRKPSGN